MRLTAVAELEGLKRENMAIQNTTNAETETRSKKHAEVV